MRVKKKITGIIKTGSFLLAAVLLFSSGYAQQKMQAEALVPGSAGLFVQSSPLKTFVKSLKFLADNLLDAQQKDDFYKGVKEFNDKSGLDLLNPASLTSAGIDVNRTFSVAYSGRDTKGVEKIIVFIPILNEKTFPSKFIEVIKKNSGDEHQDTYPAITKYKGQQVYQMQNDVFGAAVNGWFVVAPTAGAVNEVLDLKGGSGSSLAVDKLYMDYLKSSKTGLDLNAFMKRDFLDMLAGSAGALKKPDDNNNYNDGGNDGGDSDGNGNEDNPEDGGQSFNFNNIFRGLSLDDKPGLIMAQHNHGGESQQGSVFSMVDYMSASVGLKGSRVVVNTGAKFNNTNPLVGMVLNLLQTGTADKSIYIEKSKAFSYISFDLNHLEKICEEQLPGCDEYAGVKTQINTALGIDVSAEFLPNYTGAVNIIITEMPKGQATGKFVAFLPMKNQAKTAALLDKMTAKVVQDLGSRNQAGKTSIGGQKGFWFMYQTQKFFVVSDAKGIYIGSTADVISKAMKSTLLSKQKNNSLVNRMTPKVFFLTYITREAYAGPMMMMQGQAGAGGESVEKIANRMGDIYIAGERAGNSLSLDFEIEIIKPAK